MSHALTFLGAARNVTGSSYLLDCNGTRIVVDCGLYQERDLRNRNWDPFPVRPDSVDAVLLTHAHLDHCGLLPKFVREGFQGSIYATPATADIAGIVMLDSAKIQEEDAAYKRKRHEREGRQGPYPEVPLYTIAEAEQAVARLSPLEYDQALPLSDDVTATFHDAGHILGSAMIRIVFGNQGAEKSIVFSGDVGRWNTPILRDPTCFDSAQYMVTESTYGNRVHKDNHGIPDALADVINATSKAGGNVVIPSFAVERAQELLYHLSGLLAQKRIPRLPVFVDSPMAIRVTDVFKRHEELFDEETLERLRQGKHPCDFPGLVVTRTADQSKAINKLKEPAVIIAGSGMCTGGRIKHHLVNNISRPESTILFVGYQAVGTLGRHILEGADEVRIHGEKHPVAARVAKINGFSAHADRDELIKWLTSLEQPPSRVFVTHGEPESAEAFARTVQESTGWAAHVAEYKQTVELD